MSGTSRSNTVSLSFHGHGRAEKRKWDRSGPRRRGGPRIVGRKEPVSRGCWGSSGRHGNGPVLVGIVWVLIKALSLGVSLEKGSGHRDGRPGHAALESGLQSGVAGSIFSLVVRRESFWS